MNNKFFKLPLEKQQRIINAAYKVFSQSNYKKAPMSEIAEESGISKALLFHYFGNKKGLYLYLWINAIEMTRKAIREYKTLETSAIQENYSNVSEASEKIVFEKISFQQYCSE